MEKKNDAGWAYDKNRHAAIHAKKAEDSMDADALRIAVTKIISELGIKPNVKGFFYLREAIILKTNLPEHMTSVTKIIYPGVAKIFDTSPARVESAIRHSIEVAWEKGDICNKPFGCGTFKKKPTNSECIATVVDCLDLYGKAESIV